jgi:5-hydroxyisourate hydrolase
MTNVPTSISTHVLDSVTGRPAAGMAIRLEASPGPGHHFSPLGQGVTDTDGRVRDFGCGELAPGLYRLVFATGPWQAEHGRESFYPQVVIPFTAGEGHHHVPILLSPFAYSTYRGS